MNTLNLKNFISSINGAKNPETIAAAATQAVRLLAHGNADPMGALVTAMHSVKSNALLVRALKDLGFNRYIDVTRIGTAAEYREWKGEPVQYTATVKDKKARAKLKEMLSTPEQLETVQAEATKAIETHVEEVKAVKQSDAQKRKDDVMSDPAKKAAKLFERLNRVWASLESDGYTLEEIAKASASVQANRLAAHQKPAQKTA